MWIKGHSWIKLVSKFGGEAFEEDMHMVVKTKGIKILLIAYSVKFYQKYKTESECKIE